MFPKNSDSRKSAALRPLADLREFGQGVVDDAKRAAESLRLDYGRYDQGRSDRRSAYDYARLIFKHRYLIASIVFVIVGVTAAYSLRAPAKYTATATLKIGTYFPLLPGRGIEDELQSQTREQDYFNTQVDQLASLTLANRVLLKPGLAGALGAYNRRNPEGLATWMEVAKGKPRPEGLVSPEEANRSEADEHYDYSLDFLQSYQDRIQINDVKKTALVKISAVTSNPRFSALLANTHAQAFIELSREELRQSAHDNLIFLREQAEELGDRVTSAEHELGEYAEKNEILPLTKDENVVVAQLGALSRMLTEVAARRIKSESELATLRTSSAFESTALDDDSTKQIRAMLRESEAEYALMSEKFKSSYPKMIELRARMRSLQKSLDLQRGKALQTVEAQVTQQRAEEDNLRAQFEMQKSKAFESSRRNVQYNVLQREYESLKELHQAVLTQLKEAQLSAEGTHPNVILSEYAAVPTLRSGPKRVLNISLALLFGLLIGFAAALARENLNNSIQTIDDINGYLGLACIGIVPFFHPDEKQLRKRQQRRLTGSALKPVSAQSSVAPQIDSDGTILLKAANEVREPEEEQIPTLPRQRLIVLSAPHSLSAEAFRLIRTNLLLSSADTPPRKILITSASKGEGKTTVSANLAIALAQGSSKTVLIEGDLRRPRFEYVFHSDPSEPGLVEFLSGQRPLEDVIRRTPVENLWIIPAGSATPNPAELVGSRRMAELVQTLSETFDYVLIDTPPVIPVADGLMLSRIADGVIMVVRSGLTAKSVARDVTRKFSQVNAKMIGVVVNHVDLRNGEYHPAYYSGYEYLNDREREDRRVANA
ncbi:MAG: polysaccharide biosynthesis tyrosine autokinase [Deltaproteobacteria bacterium]|nr:polysaccharide biosynthesis tyrosine autokinase [Deltaproteobacteria bacterium]